MPDQDDAKVDPTGENLPEVREASRLDAVVSPFLEDSMRWPLLLTALGILVTFGALTIDLALRDRQLSALVTLFALLWLSVVAIGGDLRKRRFGPGSRVLTVFWLLSFAGAYAAVRMGAF
jgi:hypothetical protein